MEKLVDRKAVKAIRAVSYTHLFQCGIPEGMPSWSKRNGEVKACHAGKPVPKVGISGGRCRNRMPHTCRGGSRRNSIPDESPIPSCSQAESIDVYSYRKNSRFPYNRRFAFFAVMRKCGQECRHRQEPDGTDQSALCGQKYLGTAVYRAGK